MGNCTSNDTTAEPNRGSFTSDALTDMVSQPASPSKQRRSRTVELIIDAQSGHEAREVRALAASANAAGATATATATAHAQIKTHANVEAPNPLLGMWGSFPPSRRQSPTTGRQSTAGRPPTAKGAAPRSAAGSPVIAIATSTPTAELPILSQKRLSEGEGRDSRRGGWLAASGCSDNVVAWDREQFPSDPFLLVSVDNVAAFRDGAPLKY